ncbi:MAG: hypothetical protein ACYTAS_07005 [Planctomycetota bacterium]|jgi:hypothetical protein
MALGEVGMKVLSVTCGVVVLLCLLSFPVIAYVGGRQCMPLAVPPLLPAEIVPFGIGFVAVLVLMSTAVASLVAKRDRRWSLGALAIALTAIGVSVLWDDYHLPGFLHGLRDRFVAEVGYAKMREFAREVSQDGFLLVVDGVLGRPGEYGAATPRAQEQWDDLVSRYRFLGWNKQSGVVVVGEDQVELHWGRALTGHWGFQVSTGAPLEEPEEDRGRVLRVADDIQFVEYYD